MKIDRLSRLAGEAHPITANRMYSESYNWAHFFPLLKKNVGSI